MEKENLTVMMGEKIRSNRLSRNLSLEELAELLDITSGYLGLMERGKRGISVKYLSKLSDIFDIPVSAFFSCDKEIFDIKDTLSVLKREIGFVVNDMSEKELRLVLQTVLLIKEYRKLN